MRVGLFLMVCAIAWAQTETVTRSVQPWTGDWLPLKSDNMVNGERYKGYPGPLPKFFYAIGKDIEHPAIGYDIRYGVDRLAPNWYGKCDGWSTASLLYPQPVDIVLNGVKLFSVEQKALLTTIWGDTPFGNIADWSSDSLDPFLLSHVLEDRFKSGDLIIFEIDPGDEMWNYPVYSYTKQVTETPPWTNYSFIVTFSAPKMMKHVSQYPVSFQETYSYRINQDGTAEWTSPNWPDAAWIPKIPYYPGTWKATSNRYINETFLLEAFADAQSFVDFSEPNDTMEDAKLLDSEMVLSCLPLNDVDFYRLEDTGLLNIPLDFIVYDGPPISIDILAPDGSLISTNQDIDSIQFQLGNIPGPFAYVKVYQNQPGDDASFYRIEFPKECSSLFAVSHSMHENNTIHALDASGNENAIFYGDIKTLNPFGSLTIHPDNDQILESSESMVFGVDVPATNGPSFKNYVYDHRTAGPLVIPHLAFKYNWDTKLTVEVDKEITSVEIKFYDNAGNYLKSNQIPIVDRRFTGSLSGYLGSNLKNLAGYAVIEQNQGVRVYGFIEYANVALDVSTRLNLESAPKFGTTVFPEINTADHGWNGLAILNTSQIENEILYRLIDDKGEIKEESNTVLGPGQKLQTTVQSIFGTPCEPGDHLYVFSQYEVEYFFLNLNWENGVTAYAQRGAAPKLDQTSRTNVFIPENKEEVYFLITNLTLKSEHVLFEGYDENGTLQGRFNVQLGVPLKPYSTTRVPLTQIYENGVGIKDVDAIRNLRLTIPDGLIVWELDYCAELNSWDCHSVPRLLPRTVPPASKSKTLQVYDLTQLIDRSKTKVPE